jgi:hypothetical protein
VTRAHARRHDQHKVSRAHAAIAAAITHERVARGFGNVVRRGRVQRLRQISYDRHVVGHVRVRDLLAAANAERGPDWLAKLPDKLFRGNVAGCESMTRRYRTAEFYDLTVRQQDFKIGKRRRLDYGNIVVGVDNDRVIADCSGSGDLDALHSKWYYQFRVRALTLTRG